MADGRNTDSGGRRTLNLDLNIPYRGAATGSTHDATASASDIGTSNDQNEPVSQERKPSNLPLNVLPIKKRRRPDEEPISLENASQNPAGEQMPGPGSRRLPPEAYCFRKSLSSTAVSQDGRLYLSHQEAATIPCCPQMTEDTRDSFRKSTLMVFDGQDRQWSMVLTGYNYENQILYTLSGDWKSFVRTHGLSRGDTICFYKNHDPRVAAGYYYVMLFRKRIVQTTAVR
ncbi:hypothetical protein F511_09969 [Dorcoceras hygrometricum]|uniref:TF-B3 domain-containing protein n=1 Tax=Dorcoceras hygrometricum TaxID=472368 RepID=A0A2Z7D3E7_9LAMI|nr:hypothetical protein F511_09969 [Dorcoceras hygrometricum]